MNNPIQSNAIEVLRKLEWVYTPQWAEGPRDCPICNNSEPDGHKPDCRLALALQSIQDPLKNALHHFLSFGRPREGSDRYHKAWDKLKESFEGMK